VKRFGSPWSFNVAINRMWILASRPDGMVSAANFGYQEGPVRRPSDGELLVRVLYVSFDPSTRASLDARPSQAPPQAIGEVIRGLAIGQVVESQAPDYGRGDLVVGNFGWQDYSVSAGRGPFRPTKVPAIHPLPVYLGVLGGTGLTAYFGMLEVGKPQAGETVVVSGAAGATGSVAAQIAKLQGARVIGIAGGAEKCRWLSSELRLDGAIDHRTEPVGDRLREACTDGIHLYFDNVGGELLESAIERLATRGRIVLCGMMSTYDTAAQRGPRNLFQLIVRRARMEGFLVMDYKRRFAEAHRNLSTLLAQGKIKSKEDIQEGFENIPQTFLRLFTGANIGKQLLKVADEASQQ
jgi:NADPH-dependent curcumin reductase CurA